MESQSIASILVSWFPMLLLIGLWLYFMRRQSGEGNSWPGANGRREELEELRKQTKALERIAAQLERRQP